MLTDEQIKKEVGTKADRVVITGDGISHKSIGLKVGEFSMATDITSRQKPEEQTQQIRTLLLDLKMMNVKNERQIKDAAKERANL